VEQSSNKLLNAAQAAEYLGIPKHTFLNFFYASNKTDPSPTRIGGRIFWSMSCLEEFIVANTLKTRKEA